MEIKYNFVDYAREWDVQDKTSHFSSKSSKGSTPSDHGLAICSIPY
jgi:hypothetical protein